MSKRNIESIYPLTPMQQGMLFHSVFDPESRLYFEQMSCTLLGELNVEAFKRAWMEVIRRHPAVRTIFAWKNIDNMLQIVLREMDLPIDIQDWRGISKDEQGKRLHEHLLNDREMGFDPSKAPLLRIGLFQIDENQHYFVESHHHALLDGWSLPLLIKEVLTLYEGFRSGGEIHLEPVRPFKEYITWLERQDQGAAESYWRKQLKGILSPTPLVINRSSFNGGSDTVKIKKDEVGDQSILLSKEHTDQLKEIARQHKLTINTIVLGAWALILSRYSGEKSVLFGATVSGRPTEIAGIESMVGLFINTLPVRVNIQNNHAVIAWLQEIQDHLIEMRQYEYSSLIDIQNWSEIPHGKSLFDSILIFENYPVDQSLREQQGSILIEDIKTREQTNYPINIVSASGEQIPIRAVYDPAIFDSNSISRLLGHLRVILEEIATNPNRIISNIPVLSPGEYRQIISEWNNTWSAFPENMCIHEVFEQVAAKVPDQIAVVYHGRTITYSELDRKANQLAHYLISIDVHVDDIVGIFINRSIEMVVSILGILKAGAAYLPIDPAYPADRIKYMVLDSNLDVLLTLGDLEASIPLDELERKPNIICLDSDWDTRIGDLSTGKNFVDVHPKNLAYMIYTSGSTGLPKGTMLSHYGLCNLSLEQGRIFKIKNHTRILQFSALSFDVSVWETFMGLINGGQLCLADQDELSSMNDLSRLILEEGITNITLPPSVLRVLPDQEFPKLETIISGGELCTPDLVNRWSPGRDFFNAYGPTEVTVCPCVYLCEDKRELSPPIGKPLSNVQLFVLDPGLNPVPVGIPGELFVSGAGLARGYMNRPESTAEKFLPNPFNGADGERMYRTGDLVRLLEDGNVEFISRVDEQVKVRGYRVELGEIESILQKYPEIQQNAVLVWDDNAGNSFLVAYLEPRNGKTIDIPSIKAFLADRLPGYMVPTTFVILDNLPKLPNDKVDRKALARPDAGRSSLGELYVPPRTPVESMLAEIWQQVLGIPQIGIKDNFFELGGHSLLATQVISRSRKILEVELPIRALFENPTIATFAHQVETGLRESSGVVMPPLQPLSVNMETGIPEGEIETSFSQQRLWFLDQLAPGNLFYNIPVAVKLTGNLDVNALELSINEILRRHSSLRTTFKSAGGKPMQVIHPFQEVSIPVEVIDRIEEKEDEALKRLIFSEAQNPFDLETGPLMRTRLITYRDQPDEFVFILVMHHIISDGWSMGIFISEIGAYYSSFSSGIEIKLPELTIQYYDYAHWQREWLRGEVLDKQLQYWVEQLAGQPKLLSLPTDRPRPAIQTSRGDVEKFQISQELSIRVSELCRKEDVTLFMMLLAAYQTLLYRYSGQDDVSVGTAIAGRNLAETEGLIGFFVNTLVIRSDLSGGPTFRELLKRVREVTLGAFAHQDLPFELLVEELHPVRDLSHTPLFQVAFALQNAPSAEKKSSIFDPSLAQYGFEDRGDQQPVLELPDISMSQLNVNSGTSKFDLTLSMAEGDDTLLGALEYNLDLFDRETIQRMIAHFIALIQEIVAQPDRSIDVLPLLPEEEEQQVIYQWNETMMETPTDRCAHQRFELVAASQPNEIALIFESDSITYAELDYKANQLAHYLLNTGIQPEEIIGISTLRSIEMIIGILGIMKAGAAYLPIDPSYPPDRIGFMIQDSKIKVLLTQKALVERLELDQIEIKPALVCLDSDWNELILKQPENKPAVQVSPDNLAYVIYTSGSTGLPKGTMLRHNGLSNLAEVQRIAFGITQRSRILQFSPLSFDASIWETFMALANGGKLVLARQETLASGIDLARYLDDKSVTNVTLPPSVLRVLPHEGLKSLTTVIAAGEACTPELVEYWAPGRHFFNAYGPTETTVCASMYLCDENEEKAPPIGKPIANSSLYVLDALLTPQPVGVPGELVVSGIHVARGYLRRPEMTALKFVPDPFSKMPGERMYRTGDLVRYRRDGNIEYMGRIDQQVKVRGFRIEIGEIEARLNEYAKIKEGAIVAREDIPGDVRLVGYIVPSDGMIAEDGKFDTEELKTHLRASLPEYMVPQIFVTMEELPLSPSGKVDKRSLPAPDLDRSSLKSAYVAPTSKTEFELVRISEELLGIDQIGINDNFFELGGHSLLATQFISRIRDELGVELELRQLFETPTAAQLATFVDGKSVTSIDNRARIAELIARINELSDEEVQELLELKRKNDS